MDIYIRDVGDALNIFINRSLMVDCGGNKSRYSRFPKPYWIDTFILSHFHRDHYNGLKYFDEYSFWNLEQVYFHGFSKIFNPVDGRYSNKLTKRLVSCMVAINYYLNFDPNKYIIIDLIDILNFLCHKNLSYEFKFQGDIFIHNNTEYEVLWPPENMHSDSIAKNVKDAIDAFDDIAKEIPALQKLHDLYLNSLESEQNIQKPNRDKYRIITTEESNKKDIAVEKIKEVNNKLKNAENDLSLAFMSKDKKIIFMGDLEEEQIKKVSDYLNRNNADKFDTFDIMVSPHHGTHTCEDLEIKTKIIASSVGEKLYKKHLENHSSLYKISDNLLNTRNNEDIYINIKDNHSVYCRCRHLFPYYYYPYDLLIP